MAKYLVLKHYRGGPDPVVPLEPMDRWAPRDVDAHIRWMLDFAESLKESGEFVEHRALLPEVVRNRPRVVPGVCVAAGSPTPGRPTGFRWRR